MWSRVRLVGVLLGGWALTLLLSACDLGQSQRMAALSPTSGPPTATPTATRTPSPPPTPLVVAPLTPTPFLCENAPSTRMIIAERGRVLDTDPRAVNIRAGPGTDFRILGRIEAEGLFYVLDGPQCADDYVWYKVRHRLLEGWIAEGDAASYYVEPYMPG